MMVVSSWIGYASVRISIWQDPILYPPEVGDCDGQVHAFIMVVELARLGVRVTLLDVVEPAASLVGLVLMRQVRHMIPSTGCHVTSAFYPIQTDIC